MPPYQMAELLSGRCHSKQTRQNPARFEVGACTSLSHTTTPSKKWLPVQSENEKEWEVIKSTRARNTSLITTQAVATKKELQVHYSWGWALFRNYSLAGTFPVFLSLASASEDSVDRVKVVLRVPSMPEGEEEEEESLLVKYSLEDIARARMETQHRRSKKSKKKHHHSRHHTPTTADVLRATGLDDISDEEETIVKPLKYPNSGKKFPPDYHVGPPEVDTPSQSLLVEIELDRLSLGKRQLSGSPCPVKELKVTQNVPSLPIDCATPSLTPPSLLHASPTIEKKKKKKKKKHKLHRQEIETTPTLPIEELPSEEEWARPASPVLMDHGPPPPLVREMSSLDETKSVNEDLPNLILTEDTPVHVHVHHEECETETIRTSEVSDVIPLEELTK